MTDQDPTPTEPTDDAVGSGTGRDDGSYAVSRDESDDQIRARARRALIRYGLARLGLFLALTVVIQLAAWLIGAPVPPVMSALLALLVAFPLSMLIFPRMRVEATQAVAARQERRRQRKEWIREELAGR